MIDPHKRFGTQIHFSKSPDFEDLLKYVKEYFILRNIAANGGYTIVLELSPTGKVNSKLP